MASVDYLVGYGYSKVQLPEEYHVYPLAVDFTWSLPRNKPDSHFQFQLEPYVAYAGQPSSNVEIAGSFFFKYRVMTGKFQPYIKVGSGVVYMSQSFREQSTDWNFGSSAAVGFTYMLKKEWGVTGEARYRHASNAGIKEPNSGIDSRIFLLGITRTM